MIPKTQQSGTVKRVSLPKELPLVPIPFKFQYFPIVK